MTENKRKGYKKTHINTYRFRCRKSETGYPVNQKGNYESLLSFKELPPFNKLKKNGRSWKFTKNYKPVMDRIVLDIDSENLENAFKITKKIMQDFEKIYPCINIYFSGSKGFHIEILTDELDIIDTTAEKPKDSCYLYLEFLNYFQDKYSEVDLSLKDGVTRIFRIHKTKHENTGNYKILIDINADLESIKSNSKLRKDMVEPAKKFLSKEKSLLLLKTYSKPVNNDSDALNNIDGSIYSIIYNELQTNIHDKILLIGAGLNGYVDKTELESIYTDLSKTTDIEDSVNDKQSFFDAYENDKEPCNLGALINHYKQNNLDRKNLKKFSYYLDLKLQDKSFNEFDTKFKSYNNDWFKLLDNELYDYVDNTENIFKGIINCLSALFGYGSRFNILNAGSEIGKSTFIETIEKLMPYFIDLGSSTPASVRRKSEDFFNKKIVYLGDKGLKGTTDDEFKGLQEVFGGLITDKKFIREIVVGDSVMEFELKSDGLCVFYSQPYTNLREHKAGDQYSTRSTFITINPVTDGEKVFLDWTENENKENPFYNVHKNYIRYILRNPIELNISTDIKKELFKASKRSIRTAKYIWGLFKAYCQYLQIANPSDDDADSFLKIFGAISKISDIEFELYFKLYANLNKLTDEKLELKLDESGAVMRTKDLLTTTKERKKKSFFTAKQVKTYFKSDIEKNPNLKDTMDYISDMLTNLYNGGYLERLEWQYKNQNVYYLPYNEDMEK